MNRVTLVGRLTRDPELKSTQSGTSVCNFGIAVDRRVKKDSTQKNQQTADFFNIVAWRRQAEVICQYMHKGSQIALEGRLQSRKYEKDGVKRTAVEVVLENFDFIGGKNDQSGYTNQTKQQNGFDDDFYLVQDDEDAPF